MAAISRELLKKVSSTTPPEITPAVRSLCQFLNPQAAPLYVQCAPAEGSRVGECFGNVLRHVEQYGGAIIYGWSIWLWPRVFVEAEHHAVWDDGTGRLTDITPHQGGEQTILFHPDPERRYDHEGKKRLMNVKRSLGEMKSAAEWIRTTDALSRFMQSCYDGSTIRIDRRQALPIYNAAEEAKAAVLIELAMKTRPHEPCICGRGLKFRKCCRSLVHLDAD